MNVGEGGIPDGDGLPLPRCCFHHSLGLLGAIRTAPGATGWDCRALLRPLVLSVVVEGLGSVGVTSTSMLGSV